MNKRILFGALALSLGTMAPAFGQAGPPDGPPDFAQMRQQMEQHLKDLLGASDDEWKVLQPKIEKVRKAQRDAGQGGPMGFFVGPPPGGPGGPDGGGPPPPPPDDAGGPPPGPDGNAQPSDVQEKRHDLRDAVESKDTPANELKARVQAYRDARAKAKATLASAQQDLQGVVTAKQEAVLVVFGILE